MSIRMVLAFFAALVLSVGVSTATAGNGKGGNSANAKQCYKGGWTTLYTSTGGTFASEEDCVSYAAQGGVLLTSPPPKTQSQVACETLGGTFSTDPTTSFVSDLGGAQFVWSCNNLPSEELALGLQVYCGADVGGLAYLDYSGTSPYDSTCERTS